MFIESVYIRLAVILVAFHYLTIVTKVMHEIVISPYETPV